MDILIRGSVSHTPLPYDELIQFEDRLFHRKGWPLLYDLPLGTVCDDNILNYVHFPDFHIHMFEIKEIVHAVAKSIELVHRVPSVDTRLCHETVTLLIVAGPNEPVEGLSDNALDIYYCSMVALRKYFRRFNINIRMEIIDDQFYDSGLFSVSNVTDHDANLLKLWNEVKPEFEWLLKDAGLDRTSQMRFWPRGPDEGILKGFPLVDIWTTKPHGAKWQRKLLPQMRSLVEPMIKVSVNVNWSFGLHP